MAGGGGSGVPPDRSGPADAPDSPRIGVDEWVASVEGKRERYAGLRGQRCLRAWDRLPAVRHACWCLHPGRLLPARHDQGNVFRYGLFTLVYALLALGLNIVVGFAGLLDLGYVAFFGCGAYLYAILASPQFGYHWQAEAAIPVVVVGTALVGLLVGLPSRRLFGDYLAILTLFFGQAFVMFVNNANRIKLPLRGPCRSHRRVERARQHRRVQLLRVQARLDPAAVLPLADRGRAVPGPAHRSSTTRGPGVPGALFVRIRWLQR